MQQRVGLARALAVDPEVMFLDEPFSALDPLIRRDMQNEVMRLHHDLNKTMVFITHDLAEAMKLGDRIVIMRDGDIVQMGTPADLVMNPVDGYVADFTKDIPKSHVLRMEALARPARPDENVGGTPVDAEMIVFGQTDATAYVTLGGEPVKLRSDGSFAVRLPLPDRRQVLPIVASSADGVEQRTTVLAVERNTKVMEPLIRESGED